MKTWFKKKHFIIVQKYIKKDFPHKTQMPKKSVDSDYFLRLFIIKRIKELKDPIPHPPFLTPLFPSFSLPQAEIVV